MFVSKKINNKNNKDDQQSKENISKKTSFCKLFLMAEVKWDEDNEEEGQRAYKLLLYNNLL